MPLVSSLVEPLRITSTLSARPVRTIAALKPVASASMPTKVTTTSAMPISVAAAVVRRCRRLRML